MPSQSAAQTNPILSNIAVGYQNAQHVGTRIFPIYTSDTLPARVPRFGQEDLRLVDDKATVDGGGTERTFEWATIDIDADGHMQSTFVANATKADPAMKAMIRAAKFVKSGVDLVREKVIYDACHNASLFTASETPAVKWDNSLTVDILGDVDAWCETRRTATGYRPNVLVLAPAVWNVVRKNTAILSALGVSSNREYGVPAKVTQELVADLMDLEEIIVPRVGYDSANKGQTVTRTNMWTAKTGFLEYRPPITEDEYGRVISEEMDAAAGRTVIWTGAPGATEGVEISEVQVPKGVAPWGRGTNGGVNVIATQWYGIEAMEVLSAARLTAMLA
jgi:hypothetical protein